MVSSLLVTLTVLSQFKQEAELLPRTALDFKILIILASKELRELFDEMKKRESGKKLPNVDRSTSGSFA